MKKFDLATVLGKVDNVDYQLNASHPSYPKQTGQVKAAALISLITSSQERPRLTIYDCLRHAGIKSMYAKDESMQHWVRQLKDSLELEDVLSDTEDSLRQVRPITRERQAKIVQQTEDCETRTKAEREPSSGGLDGTVSSLSSAESSEISATTLRRLAAKRPSKQAKKGRPPVDITSKQRRGILKQKRACRHSVDETEKMASNL